MKSEASEADQRTRADGRRSLLVYLKEDIIKRLKIAALDERRHAYQITEDALRNWLETNARAKKRKAKRRTGLDHD
jgi:hypothetical protein